MTGARARPEPAALGAVPPSPTPIRGRARAFRLVRPGTPAEAGERAIERVRDLWGRDWAVILGCGAGG